MSKSEGDMRSDRFMRFANLLTSDGTLSRVKLDDWNHYFQARANLDDLSFADHVLQLTRADIARLDTSISQGKRDNQLSNQLSQRTQVYIDLYYKMHDYGAIIQQFGMDEILYFSTSTVVRPYSVMVLPMVADAYEKLGNRENASAYFLLTAKVLSQTQPGTHQIDVDLLKAKTLDPKNTDIDRFRAGLAHRTGYAAAEASGTSEKQGNGTDCVALKGRK